MDGWMDLCIVYLSVVVFLVGIVVPRWKFGFWTCAMLGGFRLAATDI
jgi:hypothetical protein